MAPQLLGGVYGWGVCVITILAAVSALTAAWAARRDGGSRARVTLLGWLVLALLVWTALQAVPLPRSVVEMLQPSAVQMADDASRLLGETPRDWVPLSISPHGTWTALVKGTAVASAFFASWLLVSLGRRRWVFLAAAVSTLLMAVVALAHLAAGAERVFGLYEQVETASALLAPLVNQNHLSGFLAMGVPLLVGFGLEAQDKGARVAWLTGAAVVGASALLAVSRGGVASLVCGLIVLGLLGLLRKKRGGTRERLTPLLVIGATASALAAMGLYVASEGLFRDFEQGDMSKLELAGEGLGLALDHPWVGVGRGAFSAAFVAEHGQDVRYTHPENLLAQWSSEWGLLMALALVAILLLASARALKQARSWTHLGAFASLASIATHDLVDFATEMLGVAVVVTAIAAGALAPSRRARSRPSESETKAMWPAAGCVGIAAICAVVIFGWQIDLTSPYSLRRRLESKMTTGDRPAFAATLQQAVRLHPSEPMFFLLGGAEAVRHGEARALPWLNQAMRAASGWHAPHVEAARYLARTGRASQAFAEIREAELRQRGSGTALACQIVRQREQTAETLVRTARTDDVGLDLVDRVAQCLPLESDAVARLDAHLTEHDVRGARLRGARRALAADQPDQVLGALEPLGPRPDDADVAVLRARAHLALDQPGEATGILESAIQTSDRPDGLLRLLAEAHAAADEAGEMRATIERLRGRAAGRAHLVAASWILQGRLERSMGNDGAAMQAFERANRLDPSSAGLHHVAELSEQLRDFGRAYRAYARLCREARDSGPHCAARDRVRGRMVESPALAAQPLVTP